MPTPPRSRYAAVVTSAFVGAGVVAIGAGGALPDAKAASPTAVSDLSGASTWSDVTDRAMSAERSSRDNERGRLANSMNQDAPDVWLLPFKGYRYTSPYGMRWGRLHAGVDLAMPEGTRYHAVHAGTVKLARWYGGYGNCIIIDHGNGIETVYGHASRLLVSEGQEVKAGAVLGEVGNTGHSYGAHLHLEVHEDGVPREPIQWFKQHGVDIKLEVEAIFGGVAS